MFGLGKEGWLRLGRAWNIGVEGLGFILKAVGDLEKFSAAERYGHFWKDPSGCLENGFKG